MELLLLQDWLQLKITFFPTVSCTQHFKLEIHEDSSEGMASEHGGDGTTVCLPVLITCLGKATEQF